MCAVPVPRWSRPTPRSSSPATSSATRSPTDMPHSSAPPPAAGVPARRAHPASRGSVLITALILAAIIAISLTSYIKLALNSLTLADRSFYQNAAVNLTEVGIEEAMYCYNQLDNV